MYNKVLIISDNLVLCQKFIEITNDLNINDATWSFAISPYSNIVDFKKSLEKTIKVYNLNEEKNIDEIISSYDLVFSMHCKQIFPDKMVNGIKCINIHPGYNPINRGWFPQVFAIMDDLPIGATIHEIDCELDHGPIIARKFVEKSELDTSGTLYNKIIDAEIILIKENLISILKKEYITFLPENEGNLYLKKDFDKLCKLDLEEMLTIRELINKLRALTHGDYKNAFYIDSFTGKKVYVKMTLEFEE